VDQDPKIILDRLRDALKSKLVKKKTIELPDMRHQSFMVPTGPGDLDALKDLKTQIQSLS
jgi:hypothetical protein